MTTVSSQHILHHVLVHPNLEPHHGRHAANGPDYHQAFQTFPRESAVVT